MIYKDLKQALVLNHNCIFKVDQIYLPFNANPSSLDRIWGFLSEPRTCSASAGIHTGMPDRSLKITGVLAPCRSCFRKWIYPFSSSTRRTRIGTSTRTIRANQIKKTKSRKWKSYFLFLSFLISLFLDFSLPFLGCVEYFMEKERAQENCRRRTVVVVVIIPFCVPPLFSFYNAQNHILNSNSR